jgi:hypothetical protein
VDFELPVLGNASRFQSLIFIIEHRRRALGCQKRPFTGHESCQVLQQHAYHWRVEQMYDITRQFGIQKLTLIVRLLGLGAAICSAPQTLLDREQHDCKVPRELLYCTKHSRVWLATSGCILWVYQLACS